MTVYGQPANHKQYICIYFLNIFDILYAGNEVCQIFTCLRVPELPFHCRLAKWNHKLIYVKYRTVKTQDLARVSVWDINIHPVRACVRIVLGHE